MGVRLDPATRLQAEPWGCVAAAHGHHLHLLGGHGLHGCLVQPDRLIAERAPVQQHSGLHDIRALMRVWSECAGAEHVCKPYCLAGCLHWASWLKLAMRHPELPRRAVTCPQDVRVQQQTAALKPCSCSRVEAAPGDQSPPNCAWAPSLQCVEGPARLHMSLSHMCLCQLATTMCQHRQGVQGAAHGLLRAVTGQGWCACQAATLGGQPCVQAALGEGFKHLHWP